MEDSQPFWMWDAPSKRVFAGRLFYEASSAFFLSGIEMLALAGWYIIVLFELNLTPNLDVSIVWFFAFIVIGEGRMGLNTSYIAHSTSPWPDWTNLTKLVKNWVQALKEDGILALTLYYTSLISAVGGYGFVIEMYDDVFIEIGVLILFLFIFSAWYSSPLLSHYYWQRPVQKISKSDVQ